MKWIIVMLVLVPAVCGSIFDDIWNFVRHRLSEDSALANMPMDNIPLQSTNFPQAIPYPMPFIISVPSFAPIPAYAPAPAPSYPLPPAPSYHLPPAPSYPPAPVLPPQPPYPPPAPVHPPQPSYPYPSPLPPSIISGILPEKAVDTYASSLTTSPTGSEEDSSGSEELTEAETDVDRGDAESKDDEDENEEEENEEDNYDTGSERSYNQELSLKDSVDSSQFGRNNQNSQYKKLPFYQVFTAKNFNAAPQKHEKQNSSKRRNNWKKLNGPRFVPRQTKPVIMYSLDSNRIK